MQQSNLRVLSCTRVCIVIKSKLKQPAAWDKSTPHTAAARVHAVLTTAHFKFLQARHNKSLTTLPPEDVKAAWHAALM